MKDRPGNFQWISKEFGPVMKAHQQLGQALQEAGPLGRKQAQLIQIAAAAAARSEGGVHSHVKRARAARARPEEIYHAILLLTSTIGFPAVAAALSWARETIESGK